ncbi:MAG: hypothetical protein IJT00_03890, partial [Lachnospiraceae bacterium]|nr:hypothetical protein [Lachnospiraceae bacterium]
PEWDCESIAITPFHSGVALIRPLGFGGRYGMKDGDTWNLCFHDELVLRTQISDKWNTLGALSANLVIETGTADNAGTDDNVTLDVYNGTGLVKSILLDKYYCDDFEAGSRDTYSVPLADNLKEAIPPEALNMKLTCSGNAAGDAWDVSSLSITLFHGEIQLTDTVNRGPRNLYNSTWDLDITDDMRRKECTLKPLTLSYETNVGDGMLDFVYSLDGSHQYVNSKGPLWGDPDIRREVFFRIFKGFSPDIEYAGEEKEVTEGQAFDLDFTLEGMWNGTGQSRRDQVYFNPNSTPGNSDDYPSMPTVSGNATISFIDSNKSVVCYVHQKVSNGEIQLRDYKNDSLTAGTYSLKVKYDPDSTDPMYAAAEEVFNDKLTVIVTGCAHEHTEIRNAVQADCVTRGYSGDEYCTDCGSRVKKGHSNDVDPDRHDPDKGVITREATHLSDGVKTHTCRRCGVGYTEAIPRLTDDDDSNTLVEDVKKMNGEAAISENVLRREDGGTETRVIIDGKEVSRIVKDAEGNAVEVKTEIWTGGLMSSYRYTGSAIKPVFHVYDGAKLLREKTDYSVGFKNNKKAGADADVTIRFKGNYKGTEVKHFHIEPAVIGEDVIIYDTSVAKTGREIKPALDVLWAGTGKKVSPKEFKFECGADIRDTGVYSVSVAPRDVSPNFNTAEGFKTRGVLVVTDKANLLSGASVKLDPKQKYYYTGDEIVPKKGSYTLTLNGSDLEEGKDYVVDSVRNNVDPGTATIVFRAVKADYNAVSGMKTASFKIQKVRDILNEEGFVVTCSDAVPYAKGGPKPDITVSYGGRRLKAGKDYAVKYGKNTSVTGGKTAEITVSGKGNFKGKKTLNYSVERQDLAVLSANILVNDVTGSGGTYGKPAVTVTDLNGKALKAGTDFELRNYAKQDGGNEVTVDVAGIGNYEGTVSASFRVIEKDQQIGRLKAERVSDRIYTGEKVTLTEKDLRTLLFTGEKNNSEYLAPGTDFEVAAYSNNMNTGTARVTLRGLGKYGGTKIITFKIIRRSRQ